MQSHTAEQQGFGFQSKSVDFVIYHTRKELTGRHLKDSPESTLLYIKALILMHMFNFIHPLMK